MAVRAGRAARVGGGLGIVFLLVLALLTYTQTDLFNKAGAAIVLVLAAVAFVSAYLLSLRQKTGWGFLFSALTILFLTAAVFWGLFPRVMVSSLNPAWNLTIYNASSSPYTLKIMTIVALTLVPFVLAYQAWTYWVFRERVSVKKLHY